MELLELSEEKLHEENKKLYELIIKKYDYDLVIFVARGSFIIGEDLAKYNEANLIEIFATRSGGKIKKILSPILKIIPKGLKSKLRQKEFDSNYHEKKSNRKIFYDDDIWKKYKNSEKILLVDDSVDTGYSIKCSLEVIKKYFKNSEVKVAALNYFDKSKNIVKTDFSIYNEKLLLGPWSNDSKENKDYLQKYNNWHNNQ